MTTDTSEGWRISLSPRCPDCHWAPGLTIRVVWPIFPKHTVDDEIQQYRRDRDPRDLRHCRVGSCNATYAQFSRPGFVPSQPATDGGIVHAKVYSDLAQGVSVVCRIPGTHTIIPQGAA